MADKNSEDRRGGVRVKPGVLPGVREIRRPDFTKKAADIEKAEAERVLRQGENTDAADEAAVKASLEAQQAGGEEQQHLGTIARLFSAFILEHMADFFRKNRPAGLAGFHDFNPLRLQSGGETGDLGGFPAPFTALESYEPAARHRLQLQKAPMPRSFA